ncbi:uncharacterized protein LOC111815646, partial [Octodon degus]|uniref:Uncharacterized protein LOC111815646 n=1 Tax=Octodon degus TaxID=10160 RepID=A0A6P6E3N7_OCTDE
MAPIWELVIRQPPYLNLLLSLGALVLGVGVLFATCYSRRRGGAKTDSEISKQRNLKKIQKCTVSESEENLRMECSEDDLSHISGFPADWTEEYRLWSMVRSLQQIIQQLESARLCLMELYLLESQDVTSSTTPPLEAQDTAPSCCICEETAYSSDHSISSGSSSNSSSLSYLPAFFEETSWQVQSNRLPVSRGKQPSVFRNQRTTLSPFQLSEPEGPELLQDLEAVSHLPLQNYFIHTIFKSPTVCKQEEKTKHKRRSRNPLALDYEPNSVLNERPQLPGWSLPQLSPLARGELEGHMSWKVRTLQEQTVPVPVKKSWAMLNYLIEVPGGVSELENSQTQLSTLIHQSTEQNMNNTFSDLLSSQLHMNTGVESGLNRTETKLSLISGKQLQHGNDPQILGSKHLVTSMSTPSSRHLGVNRTQEESALLKKDSKHVLDLSAEQSATDIPEKSIQQHNPQVTHVELTPRLPYKVTDNIKITPLALLQVTDSIGMIPESCSEMSDSVDLFPQTFNQVVKPMEVMETVHVTPKSPSQITESVKVTPETQQRVVEPNRITSRLNQVIDNVKITPVALLQVVDSKRMVSESHPSNAEPVGMTPRPQYEAMESGEMSTLLDTMMPQHATLEAVEMAPGTKHGVMESVNRISGSQSQLMEQIKITLDLIQQNPESLEMTSTSLHQVIDHMKIIPLLQTMSFGEIPPVQTHDIESEGFIPGSQSKIANLTPKPTQPDGLTPSSSTAITPLGVVESESLLSESPLKVMESSRKILIPSHQSIHSLNEHSTALAAPAVTITEHKKCVQLTPSQQLKLTDSTELSSGLQTVKYEQPISSMKSVYLAPELQSQSVKSEELAFTTQLPSSKSMDMIPNSQFQGIQCVHLAPPPECQDKKMVELTLRPPLEKSKSVELPPKPWLQNASLEKVAQVLLPKDTKTAQAIEGRRSTSETQVQSMKSGELIPGTHLQPVKYIELEPDQSHRATEPEQEAPQKRVSESLGMVTDLGYQGTVAKSTSDTRHQVEASIGLTQSSLGIIPVSLSQTSKSIKAIPSSFQDTTGTMLSPIKVVGLTPELQSTVKESLDSIPGSEVQSVKSEVLTPEPQPQGMKPVHLNGEPHSQATKLLERPLKSDYEDTEAVGLSFPQVDKMQEAIQEPHSQTRSLELTLRPEIQPEKSGLLLKNLKSVELTCGSSPLVVEAMELITGSKSNIIDVASGPQLQGVKSRQTYPEAHLQDTKCVIVTPPSSTGCIESKKPKSEKMPQSILLGELTNRAELPSVKSVDSNLDSGQSNVKSSGLTLGPQLQSVRFSKLSPGSVQGEKPIDLTLGPPHYGVIPDEMTPSSPVQEIKSSEFIPGSKHQNVRSVQSTPVELKSGPCLKEVKFSDLISDLKPGAQLQDTKPRRFVTESSLHLSQGLQVEDIKSIVSTKGSHFHRMKPMKLISERQFQDVKFEEVNQGQKNTNFSELIAEPSLQGVIFGEQISGVNSAEVTPELEWYDSKLAKMSPGFQDMKQVALKGPWLQDVLNLTPGTQPGESMKSPELNSGTQLQGVKFSELTSQPERQGVKQQSLVPELCFQDGKYVTVNQIPGFEDEISYKLVSEPQIPNVESMELSSGTQSTGVNHPELARGQWSQGTKYYELIQEPQLEDIKPVDQTPVSRPQGLKSGELVLEPHTKVMMTSVEVSPRPHLGDRTSMKLTPTSNSREVKSMVLDPGPQTGGIQTLELAPGSELEGLKSELMPSGLQLKDKKSVVLTPGPCLEGLKSMELTSNPQLEDAKSMEVTPGSRIRDLKTEELVPGTKIQDLRVMKLKLGQKIQGKDSMAFPPDPLPQVVKSREVLESPQTQSMKTEELTSESQIQDMKLVAITPLTKPQNLKSVEDTPHAQLQCERSMKLASRLERQEAKSVSVTRRQSFQGVKPVDLDQKQRFHGVTPVSLTLNPEQDSQIFVNLPGWKHVNLEQLKRGFESDSIMSLELVPEPKSKCIKSVHLNSKIQSKDMTSSELVPERVIQDVRAKALKYEPQLQNRKSPKLTPGPQFQDIKTVELSKEPQIRNMKTIQWISKPEFQGMTSAGSNLRSKSQSMKPAELKSSTELGGMKSSQLTEGPKLQGPKSTEFNTKSQLQCVKTPKWFPGQWLQNRKPFASTSGPQLGNMKSLQWIPGPDFQGVKSVGLNLKKCQGVKPKKLKSSTQSGGMKSSDLIQEPKFQGAKSIEFDLEPQVQCGETPALILGSELQKGKPFGSASDPQLQGRKSTETYQGPQLASMKSIEWMPRPEFQVIKSVLNFGPRSQGVTAVELKPSEYLKNVKTSELPPRSELQCIQSLVSLQEYQPQGLKPIEMKSGPECRSMKSYDQTSKSKLCDVKSMVLKPQLHLQNVKSELVPGQQLQAKPLKSSPGTQLQGMKSVVSIQEPQFQEVKSRILSHSPELQSNENGELNSLLYLKSMKPPEFALQTRPPGMKSEELNSGPQWQSIKCSKLTPEIKPQYIKCVQLSPCSQLKGIPCSDLTMQNRVECVKSTDFRPQPQLKGIKSSESTPRTQLQEAKLMESNLGPQLQDVKSSKLIMGIKLQDVKSMHFSSEPDVQGVKSPEMILGTELQGVKIVDSNFGPQIQSPKSELAQGTKFQDVKSVEFNCDPKLEGTILALLPKTKLEGGESAKFNSGPQLQDVKYSNLVLGTKFKDTKSIEFGSRPYVQDVKSGIIPETKLQKEEVGIMPQLLQQGVKSQLTLSKVRDRKPLRSSSAPPLQNRQLSMLTPQINDEGIKSVQFNPSTELQGVKSESKNLPTINFTEVNDGSELQFAKLSSELNAGNQQDKKSHRLGQSPQIESAKFAVFHSGPHLQYIKSSESCPGTKLQGVESMEFNSEQSQDVNSELCLRTKLPGMQSSEFNHEPQLERIKSFELCTENKPPDKQSLEFKQKSELEVGKPELDPRSQIQCKNFITVNTGSQLQGVESSDLKPTTEFQDIKSKGLCLEPHLQGINSFESISGLNPQCVNSTECNPEPHFNGVDSPACALEPRPQYMDSAGCNPEPHLQGMNSSACTTGTKPQCVNSTGCNARQPLQNVNHFASSSGSNPHCIRCTSCNLGPPLQCVSTSASSSESKLQCANSTGCNTELPSQGVNTSTFSPEPKPQYANSTGCNPEPYLQGVNSFAP